MLHKSKLIAIRGKYILLVRNRRTKQYNLPGGHAERGETPLLTLRRELSEELPSVRLKNLRRWRNPPRFKKKKTTFYFAQVKGVLKTEAEVDRAVLVRRWWKLKLSRSTYRTLELLVARGYLKW